MVRPRSSVIALACLLVVLSACGGASQPNASATAGGSQGLPVTSPAEGSGPVTAVAGGAFSACALLSDGAVMCWGNNVNGELGNGSTDQDANVMAPPATVIGLSSGVRAIAASGYHTNCALLTSGTVKCWGAGALGTGVNQYTVATTPLDVPSVSGATTLIAVGAGFCVIISGGALQCWGSTFGSDLPVAIAGLSDVVAISGFGTDVNADVCAAFGDGSVKCWGDNQAGQLGNGSTSKSSTPVDVVGLSGVKTILTANKYSCAVTSAGGVKCWGAIPSDASTNAAPVAIATDLPGFASGARDLFNNAGQLGFIMTDGSVKHVGAGSNYGADLSSLPAPIQAFSTNTSNDPACVLTLDGRVLCRSFTSNGDPWPMVQGLVIGGSAAGPTPTPAAAGNVARVSLGGQGGCVITTAGGVKCWGANPGNGSTQSQAPVDVLGLTGGVSAVSVAADHTCALTAAGGVKCWGTAALGTASAGSSLIPVDVTGLTSGVKRIIVGSAISCAITTAGGVKCWGTNGVLPLSSPTPVDVPGLSSGVSDLTFGQSAGNSEICALIDGSVKCWDNAGGNFAWKPVPGLGTDNAAVASGGACALTGAGGLKCWDTLVFFSGAATDLAGLTSGVSAVALNYSGGCVITTAGGVKCWGANLGNGTTETSTKPVDVPGLSGVVDIATNGRDTCVATADHLLKCWGTSGTAPVTLPIP